MRKITNAVMTYWQHPFFEMKHNLNQSTATKLILTAVLSSFAAILQSAGGYIPGIGFFASAMTTLPIFLATIVSVRHGFLSYFVTIFLLLMMQPSELIIFPFTTGILGLALGICFFKLMTKIWVVIFSGSTLFTGIIALLYIFRFPVLGPGVGTSFHIYLLLLVEVFGIVYAWIAAAVCSFALKRFNMFLFLSDSVIKSVPDQKEVNQLEDDSAKKDNLEVRK